MAQERSLFGGMLMAGAVVALVFAAFGTIGAVQAGGPFQGMRGGPGFGGPMGGFMIERALGAVDATDEQRKQIGTIVDAAKADIGEISEGIDNPKEQLATLLSAEPIDRAAVDALRRQMLEAGDAVSTRAMQALLDAAEVLTPEQRAKLIEQMPDHGRGFGPGRW